MYALIRIPSIVERYAPDFEDLFSPEGYRYFRRYLSGLLVSENKTLEAINRLFVLERRNQSSFNRFVNRQCFDLEALNSRRVGMMQSAEATRFKSGHSGKHGVLALDDTLMSHWGKHFDGIYNLWDHVQERFCLAHNLVSLHYSDDKTDYPVFHELWRPPDWEKVAEKMRELSIHVNAGKWERRAENVRKWNLYMRDRFRDYQHREPQLQQAYRTKVLIGLDILRRFRRDYPRTELPLAMDHGYTSADACRIIDQELGMGYVGSLAGHQLVKAGGSAPIPLTELLVQLKAKHRSGDTQFFKTTVHFKDTEQTHYAYCANHHIPDFGKQRLVVSYQKEDLSDTPRYSVSNRLNWFASGILRIRRHRWPVETFHQEGKEEGLDKYQVRNTPAISTHIAFVSLAYTMLKRTAHDPELLSMLRQRLGLEPNGTPPFLRRLTQTEGLMALIEFVHLKCQQGTPLGKLFEQLLQPLAH